MAESFYNACRVLGIEADKCRKLDEACRGTRTKRKRSLWQQCISERRKGKPFDPQAIKKLAIEYHAGRCPSGT